MKQFHVTIKSIEYETYIVDASSPEEAEQLIDAAIEDGSLWNGPKYIKHSSTGDAYWEIEPDLTDEVPSNVTSEEDEEARIIGNCTLDHDHQQDFKHCEDGTPVA